MEHLLFVLYARNIIENTLHQALVSQPAKGVAFNNSDLQEKGKEKEEETSGLPSLGELTKQYFGDEKTLVNFMLLATHRAVSMPFFSLSKGTPQRNQIPLYNQRHDTMRVENPKLKATVDTLLRMIMQNPSR